MQPRLHTSVFLPYGFLLKISGDMLYGVPHAVCALPPVVMAREMPRSPSFTTPDCVRKMLASFRSLDATERHGGIRETPAPQHKGGRHAGSAHAANAATRNTTARMCACIFFKKQTQQGVVQCCTHSTRRQRHDNFNARATHTHESHGLTTRQTNRHTAASERDTHK